MKPIQFPGHRIPNDTIPSGEDAVITFTDPGYFSHCCGQVFSPDLPTGFVGVDGTTETVIVSGKAGNPGKSETLSFWDQKDGNLYQVILTVV